MSNTRFEADLDMLDETPLPETATQIIHTLACKVALCSRMPPGECEVIATIRGRPVDGHGRTGCHVEFSAAGPPPLEGLQAVRTAGGELALSGLPMAHDGNRPGQPVVALHTLSLDQVLLGGWRVTVDLRWRAE